MYHDRPRLLWPLFGISNFSQMWHMFWFWKLHFSLHPLVPLPWFFFFLKKYCYIIYFFWSRGGQSNHADRGYFGHLYETLPKVAFGVNLYKHSISVFFFLHIIHFQWHFHNTISQNKWFCFKAKIECGLLWPPTKTKTSLKWLYKNYPNKYNLYG